jgi:hypothetical protein
MRSEIETLAKQMAASDKIAAKAAKLELSRLTHTAAAPRAPKAPKSALIKDLLAIASSDNPRLVRAHAIYLLSCIGDRTVEKALAPLEKIPELTDNVQMARTRLRRV